MKRKLDDTHCRTLLSTLERMITSSDCVILSTPCYCYHVHHPLPLPPQDYHPCLSIVPTFILLISFSLLTYHDLASSSSSSSYLRRKVCWSRSQWSSVNWANDLPKTSFVGETTLSWSPTVAACTPGELQGLGGEFLVLMVLVEVVVVVVLFCVC